MYAFSSVSSTYVCMLDRIAIPVSTGVLGLYCFVGICYTTTCRNPFDHKYPRQCLKTDARVRHRPRY